ncbi:hypothetical protein BGI27_04155 [Candidatus Dactylopiibacterium carminicum]|uniref:Uncharacterized protein n=1 Tax=Candidatus Dactylopiibacterium carminicum TaxID=857335 RepID=A0ABQ7HSJ8_9RHOO|nr:hypothetical protein BGI27_04155 [Candidatus Dactylopiibacterium carminicum]PAT00095.1 MAG: hypothetical protein BSR46_04185 [Candidatus Dactylopiibacterium carminicum]
MVCVPPEQSTDPVEFNTGSGSNTTDSNGNSVGGGTTTQETTCSGGSCTTTTTTTGSDGSSTSTTTTGASRGDSEQLNLCQQMPQLSICKNGSFTGTYCQTAPSCDGDAVQCAQATQLWQIRCQWAWAEEANDLSAIHDETSQNLPTQAEIDAALNKDGSGDLDIWATFQEKRKDYLTFSGSCIAEKGFTYKGREYKFDLSILCELGKFLRLIMHIIAYIGVVHLLSRTVPT